MKKILTAAILLAFVLPAFLSCVQDAEIDDKIVIEYPLQVGLGRFTAWGGWLPFQSGWDITNHIAAADAAPTHLVIETKPGGSGLGEAQIIINTDGWYNMGTANWPAGFGGAWSTPALSFVIDLTVNPGYYTLEEGITADDGQTKLIIQFNNNDASKISLGHFEAAYLIFDLEEETTLKAADFKDENLVPSRAADSALKFMWYFEGSVLATEEE